MKIEDLNRLKSLITARTEILNGLLKELHDSPLSFNNHANFARGYVYGFYHALSSDSPLNKEACNCIVEFEKTVESMVESLL